MVVAMIAATIMPAASHASMDHHQHAEKATHSEMAGMDCDHHAGKASHDNHASKEKPCCEKGVCQCLGGNCHAGLTTIIGKGGEPLLASDANVTRFAFDEEHIESATIARLKRPPKA